MFCHVLSAVISGVDALPVTVEADVSDGMPQFTIVGFVSSQVREAQDRVRTAVRNLGVSLPPRRITINLAPGDLRKDGSRFDLPIAAAVLQALGVIPEDAFRDILVAGELHLDGSTERITGVLPTVLLARERGCRACLLPTGNVREGRVVEGIRVIGIRDLEELAAFGRGTYEEERSPEQDSGREGNKAAKSYSVDFAEIHGQEAVKRASLIAAAGFHNLLLSGPPGSGKSMAAQRIPTILPELTREESLEISRIYSIVGMLPEEEPLMHTRPFRAPHHTITPAALCGAGLNPRPGEVTLAHRGVLFLDELPEVDRRTLEMLRQPMEERQITISRAGGTCTFPASFLFVAAMNPCPCGYYPDRSRCSCSPREIRRYQAKVSQALLDRMDLRCEVQAAEYDDLTAGSAGDTNSETMRAQVVRAGLLQRDRYAGTGILFNSELGVSDIHRYCVTTPEAGRLLRAAFRTLGLSARGYHHVLRVSRTIADLEGAEKISETHVSEALCFRCGELETPDTGTGRTLTMQNGKCKSRKGQKNAERKTEKKQHRTKGGHHDGMQRNESDPDHS